MSRVRCPTDYISELTSQCLYDQLQISGEPARRTLTFFSWPVGMGNPIKTFLHTNQLQSSQLPTPQVFQATRLNALFLRDGKPLGLHETGLYGKTHIEFVVAQKIYWSGPAWLCASPFALFATPKEDIPTLKETHGIEWDRVGAYLGDQVFRRDDPNCRYTGILIEYGAPFYVRGNVYSDVNEQVDLAIHIDGTIERPVQ